MWKWIAALGGLLMSALAALSIYRPRPAPSSDKRLRREREQDQLRFDEGRRKIDADHAQMVEEIQARREHRLKGSPTHEEAKRYLAELEAERAQRGGR